MRRTKRIINENGRRRSIYESKVDRVLSYTFGAYFVGMGVLAGTNNEWIGVILFGILALLNGITNYQAE